MLTIATLLDKDDYELCLKIRREVFVQEQKVPEDIEVDEFETSAQHFLVRSNGVPAGTGRFRVKDQYIKFERIATLKEFRGQGIGRFLMIEMMKEAQKHFSHLTPFMYSQKDAVSFYEKLGWVKVGDEFIEANIPHQAMSFN